MASERGGVMNKRTNIGCESCENLVAIGEGDHICYECESDDGSPCIMPICEYEPTEDYLKCGGRFYG